jgi:hypothetical protein
VGGRWVGVGGKCLWLRSGVSELIQFLWGKYKWTYTHTKVCFRAFLKGMRIGGSRIDLKGRWLPRYTPDVKKPLEAV